MVTFDNKSLAKVILGSVLTLPSNKTAFYNPKEYLFRLISFNGKVNESWAVNEMSAIRIATSELFHHKNEIENSLADYLGKIGGADNIEFISSDPLTKAVLIYTKDYMDKAVSGEVHFGELIQNYFSIWHTGKSGVSGPSGTRETHNKYGTFSKAEVNRLSEGYIPIAVASKEMPAIMRNLELILSVSALSEYMKVDIAASPTGVSVTGSRCWWVPKVVAKEYLEEKDDLQVLSKRVLYKVLYEAGLYGAPAKQDVQKITLKSLDTEKAKEFVNEQATLRAISEDFRTKDVKSTRSREAVVSSSGFGKLEL